MSSKRASKSRTKTKSAQCRRQWLKAKLEGVKISYNDTLSLFKQRLDDAVMKTVENANQILSEPDDDAFLRKVYEVGAEVEKCNDKLFEINYSCCINERDSSDEEDVESPSMSITIHDDPPSPPKETSTRRQSISSSEVKSDPKFEMYEPASLDTSAIMSNLMFSASETESTQLNHVNECPERFYMARDNATQEEKPNANVVDVVKQTDVSETFQCDQNGNVLEKLTGHSSHSIEVQSTDTDETSGRSNKTDKSNKKESNEHGDIDILLLHNIKENEKLSVIVSDVRSPWNFSIQPETCRDQLVELQYELNEMYSDMWTEKLKFCDSPTLGTLCAALFSMDHCWYRAKIVKVVKENLFQVVYIDYGNSCEIKKEDLRVLSPNFAELPQLSIACSLYGVEPAPLGQTAGDVKWSLEQTKWFDKYAFGKSFVAKFSATKQTCDPPVYNVHLLTKTKLSDKDLFWSVADCMVCMGHAAFCEKPLVHVNSSKDLPHSPPVCSKVAHAKTNRTSNAQRTPDSSLVSRCLDFQALSVPSSSSGPIKNAFPAGMERSYSRYNNRCGRSADLQSPRRVSSLDLRTSEVVPSPSHRSMTYMEYVEQQSNSGCEVFEALVRSTTERQNYALSSLHDFSTKH